MTEILERVKIAKAAIEDKKGEKAVILDISELSPIADYFLIVSAGNSNQLHAMADEVQDKLSLAGVSGPKAEGLTGDSWILLDYGDFMVHLFDKEARDFYNLERVWQDAKTVD